MTSLSPEAVTRLGEIEAALRADGPIEAGTMFRSPGLRTSGTIILFLGRNDRIILKLPRARAVALIDVGTAEAVTMGTRTLREWVSLAATLEIERVIELAREAFRYVRSVVDAP